MAAMIFKLPPHWGQRSMSISIGAADQRSSLPRFGGAFCFLRHRMSKIVLHIDKIIIDDADIKAYRRVLFSSHCGLGMPRRIRRRHATADRRKNCPPHIEHNLRPVVR